MIKSRNKIWRIIALCMVCYCCQQFLKILLVGLHVWYENEWTQNLVETKFWNVYLFLKNWGWCFWQHYRWRFLCGICVEFSFNSVSFTANKLFITSCRQEVVFLSLTRLFIADEQYCPVKACICKSSSSQHQHSIGLINACVVCYSFICLMLLAVYSFKLLWLYCIHTHKRLS